MSDAYTGVAALSSDTTAYEILSYFALRPELYYDGVADVKPSDVTHKGAAVQFQIYADIAAQTTELSETADPDAIAASDSTVTLTLKEYGAVIKTTAKLRATSFKNVNADIANLIGYNAGLSLDTLARVPVEAGTNVRYAGPSTRQNRNQVIPADTLSASSVRRARVDLVRNFVMPKNGPLYWAFCHPDCLLDLRAETGSAGWRDPHTYSDPANIWTGETGAFEGFRFIETARASIVSDAGSSTTLTDVYLNTFCGKQALAIAHAADEGYMRMPTIVMGPKVDALQRIQPIGWKWLGAYGRFREESLRRVEAASSIGVNA